MTGHNMPDKQATFRCLVLMPDARGEAWVRVCMREIMCVMRRLLVDLPWLDFRTANVLAPANILPQTPRMTFLAIELSLLCPQLHVSYRAWPHQVDLEIKVRTSCNPGRLGGPRCVI